MMTLILVVLALPVIAVGCYLAGGGWVDNGYELYRNYRRSHLSLHDFLALLVKVK